MREKNSVEVSRLDQIFEETRDILDLQEMVEDKDIWSRLSELREPRLLIRVCRNDGFIVISVMHPAMMLKGVQARFTDPRTGEKVWPRSVPNQISDYVMGAIDAGLRLTALSEHNVGEDLVARAPRAERYLGWPMLFMMVLTPPT